METKSAFQQKYPLSRHRKFWKKVIPKAFALIVVLGIVAVLSYALELNATEVSIFYVIRWATVIVVSAILLVLALYAWYVKAYIDRYFYDADDHFVTIKKGVFAPTEIHVQYPKIQDVYVDQDILDRIMGLYDVHIASATMSSAIEAHLDGVNVEVADGLKNFLLDKVRGASTPTQSQPPSVSQSPQPKIGGQAATEFNEEFSSDTYPIDKRYMPVSMAGAATGTILISLGFFFGVNWIMGIVVYVFVLIAWTAYIYVWIKNYKFRFLPEYIFTHEAVLGASEKHVPYGVIQDVNVSQSFLERIFGIATVSIENAAAKMMQVRGQNISVPDTIRIPGQTLANANKIADALKKVLETKIRPASTGL